MLDSNVCNSKLTTDSPTRHAITPLSLIDSLLYELNRYNEQEESLTKSKADNVESLKLKKKTHRNMSSKQEQN